ncbi:MAG: VanW family protein [Anaerostipes sp.]|jgi:vancomycin resistance protein YoaR|nr:VanW family protein [Anaerostipes sp.]
MNKKNLGIAAGIIVIIVVGIFVFMNQRIQGAVSNEKILPNVKVEGVEIGGLSKDEATKKIEDYVADKATDTMNFYVDDQTKKIALKNLGITWNVRKTVDNAYNLGRKGSIFSKYTQTSKKEHKVALSQTFDEKTCIDQVKKQTKKIISGPQNATLKRKNGKFIIVKEKLGYTLKEDKTFSNFKKAVKAQKNKTLMETEKEDAQYTSKDMEKVKDKLGTYSTYYGSSASGRAANVANGAKKINGTVVYPGETFSVYKAVSPFTSKNGYYLAGSYENGQTVQTYGGGICQVSTTLYNAVIRAELKIKERSPHSLTVSYVPRSADAAISGTEKDMKFKNQFDTPVYIEGKANGAYIRFTVYGKKTNPNRKVSFESETTSVRSSSGEKVIKDSSLAAGTRIVEASGHTGYTARLWKIVKEKGKKTTRTLFNTSSYMATPSTVRVGTKKSEPSSKKKDTTEKKKPEKSTEKTTEKKTTEKKKS